MFHTLSRKRGSGASVDREIIVEHAPGLAVHAVSATAWFARDEDGASRASRRVAAADLDEPIDLTDPPARIEAVAVESTSRTVIAWDEVGDADRGDGIVVVTAPSPDTRWTVVAPRGDAYLMLPEVPEIDVAPPLWVYVSLVDLDGVDGWDDLRGLAGSALHAEPGWFTTGAAYLATP